jgi:steroid 5-alpha reductase family enzyme
MVMAWVASLRLNDTSVVEVAWGIGFATVAFICFALGEGDARRLALVTGIGLVTGVALALRPRREWSDGRYSVFLAAGLAILIASLPLHGAAGSHEELGAVDYAGSAVWVVGFGLALRHVRLGEPLAWWALYAIALGGGAWWALPSPLLMTALALRRDNRRPREP